MRLAAVALVLAACGPELNPPRAPDGLADGGVYVAYNRGCERGCDEIRRGDRILAIDGRPTASSSELDFGGPRELQLARHGTNERHTVTLVADAREAIPPLIAVGAAALDRAPAWARGRLFGHAIPALHLVELGPSRRFVTGRQLYGRDSLIFVWRASRLAEPLGRAYEHQPDLYAELQRHADDLKRAGVDVYFVLDGPLPIKRDKPTEHLRSRAAPGETGFVPIFGLAGSTDNPRALGIEGGAADIDELLGHDHEVPAVLVIDRRGVVRFHADASHMPDDRLATAVEFARTSLRDAPVATR